MPVTVTAQRSRSLGLLYISLIACATTVVVVYHTLHPDGYVPGDWLINYEGGFVRRGLAGQVILQVAHALHLSPIVVAGAVPLVLYGLFYFLLWQLYRRSSLDMLVAAALVSPATLGFPILCSDGASHKELLLFVALAFLLVWIAVKRPSAAALVLYLTLTVSVLLLCHEAIAPYLLYMAAGLIITRSDLRSVGRIAILPVIAACVTLVAVVRHPGSAATGRTICDSLGPVPSIVCSGAISYLSSTAEEARIDVSQHVGSLHYLFYYPILAGLAFLPLLVIWGKLWRINPLRRNLMVVACAALIAFLGSVPLFEYGSDWGRWIYMHVICIFLLLLSIEGQRQAAPSPVRVASERAVYRIPLWAVSALVVYATCWNMPYGSDNVKKGYFNVPLHFVSQRLHRGR